MGQMLFQKRSVMALVLVLVMGMAWMGCSSTVKEKKGESTGTDVSVSKAPPSKYQARYYHFEDVLIPGELNYKPKKSFIYETPQFKAGAIYFTKWWLEVDSMIDFFIYNMEKDNWKLVNSYRGKESYLTFSKPEKTCTIRITDRWYGTTQVEVRVGPVGTKKL